SLCRARDERLAHGDARRHDDLRSAFEQRRIELAETRFRLGSELLERSGFGRRRSIVGDGELDAARAQEASAGQARATEAYDDGAAVRGVRGESRRCAFECHVHRTFRVARPTRTRITERIQKRTMTFGSAQPLSSK